MDDPSLSNGQPGERRLAGAEPIVENAVRQALEEQIADLAGRALGQLDEADRARLEQLARDSAARQLEELADPPSLYYDTLPEWVEDWLLPVYRRSVAGHERTWCAEWWRHPEAVARLDALWSAWEHLRQDRATGLSVWFRDHADHHMTILLDADGPFKGCEADGSHSTRPLEPLASDPPPAGLFQPHTAVPAPATSPAARRPPAARTTVGGLHSDFYRTR